MIDEKMAWKNFASTYLVLALLIGWFVHLIYLLRQFEKENPDSSQNPNLKTSRALSQVVGGRSALRFGRLGLCGPQLGASIAVGAGLMLFNVIILGWSWHRLIAKKSIAWTVMIIVIKYAVLLGSIFYLARMNWFSLLGAGVGISSFMMAALILACDL